MALCSWRYKFSLLGVFAIAYWVFYVYPNFVSFFTPRPLPLLWVDRVTPFLPWTVVIYLSDWILAAIVFTMIKEVEAFNSVARMAFTTLVICGLFFYLFPTVYPRPIYPTDAAFPIQAMLNLLDAADKPTNCFPSNHVAMASIFAYATKDFRNKKLYYAFVVWALLIFITTLTTKQHYFLDILGGIGVAITVVSLEYALFTIRRSSANQSISRVQSR